MINPPPPKKPAPWPTGASNPLDDCFDFIDQLDEIGDPDVDALFDYAQRAAAAESFD